MALLCQRTDAFLGRALEAFLVSTGIVTLGETGDKTQLLALLPAAKFKKPVPVILGILVANHAAAGALGVGQLQ